MPFTRRRFLQSSSLALVASVLGPRLPAVAKENGGRLEELRRGVGIFTERGGTMGWLVSDDALVVVDSQFPESAVHCLDGLRRRSQRAIDALINTHHHRDHTAGNGVFREAAKLIVAQENVPIWQKRAAQEHDSEAQQVYADTTFKTNWRLELGDETVSAKYYGPAHTAGDCVVHFENAGVVHLGDLAWNRAYPFIDRPAGAVIRGWIGVLEKVLAEHGKETLYIFGHGAEKLGVVAARKDVENQRQFFTALLDYVGKGIQAGRSVEEIAKPGRLAGFEDYVSIADWLHFESSVKVAYEELTAE
jgi:glyoxylase-like metal-dependent hydrolase (beta-lactamase superfamily II)